MARFRPFRASLLAIACTLAVSAAHAQSEEASLHEDGEYITFELDIADELNGDEIEEITIANRQLAALHSDHGFDVHVILTETTGTTPVAVGASDRLRASHADAVILIAGEDEAIGIVGQNIEPEEGEQIATFIAAHFNKGLMREGMAYGIRSTAEAMTPQD